jgi:hypothetical protein
MDRRDSNLRLILLGASQTEKLTSKQTTSGFLDFLSVKVCAPVVDSIGKLNILAERFKN